MHSPKKVPRGLRPAVDGMQLLEKYFWQLEKLTAPLLSFDFFQAAVCPHVSVVGCSMRLSFLNLASFYSPVTRLSPRIKLHQPSVHRESTCRSRRRDNNDFISCITLIIIIKNILHASHINHKDCWFRNLGTWVQIPRLLLSSLGHLGTVTRSV